jgi:hypothetical protein
MYDEHHGAGGRKEKKPRKRREGKIRYAYLIDAQPGV